MDELEATKRQLVETYLFLHNFREVRSRDEINLHFCMNLEGVRYDLTVEREWIDVRTDKKTSDRLDELQVVPFLLQNKVAWIGVTTTGQEVITHLEPDAET
ncbi:MAG: hypothetical protein HRU82_03390 [Nitrospira sp.]|nr:MAG: hypothetical protein HRU82_03390 [Nitrospira sp.]